MRIVVLGAGRQGRILADDLARALPSARIDIADVRPGAGTVQSDLSDPSALARLMAECDLAVGALPSRLGFGAIRAAIEARRPLVDLSFCPEDPLALDAEARRAGVTIVPDCGLAPGLSNLVIGRALAEGPLDEVRIQVGGIAEDPSRPYGYVVTWSVEDLLEEYTRPARIVRAGAVVTLPALGRLERVEFPGVGVLEAFDTDGLRTLLHLGIPEMDERTLRWPGHVAAVRPLLENGTLVETIRRECTASPARDLVALRILLRGGGKEREVTMVDRFDGKLTAMARTTALTCSAMAQLVAQGGVRERGVLPPERVGRDPSAYRFMLEAVARSGIRIQG